MKYQIIYADPPWKYNDKGCYGSAESQYECMDIDKLKKLSVPDIADDNCALFIWATYPMIKECLELIDAWGFTYKTLAFNWIKLSKTSNKLNFGLGRYTRGNSEPLLLATKGKLYPIRRNINEVIMLPNIRHSKKPDRIRNMIVDLMGDLPRIELFARNQVNGWHCWGNEVNSDIQLTIKGE